MKLENHRLIVENFDFIEIRHSFLYYAGNLNLASLYLCRSKTRSDLNRVIMFSRVADALEKYFNYNTSSHVLICH